MLSKTPYLAPIRIMAEETDDDKVTPLDVLIAAAAAISAEASQPTTMSFNGAGSHTDEQL